MRHFDASGAVELHGTTFKPPELPDSTLGIIQLKSDSALTKVLLAKW